MQSNNQIVEQHILTQRGCTEKLDERSYMLSWTFI